MRRRDLIKGIAGSAIAWPLAAGAQQGERTRRLGVLVGNASSADDPLAQKELNPFRDAMRHAGWIEGKTIRIHGVDALECPLMTQSGHRTAFGFGAFCHTVRRPAHASFTVRW